MKTNFLLFAQQKGSKYELLPVHAKWRADNSNGLF